MRRVSAVLGVVAAVSIVRPSVADESAYVRYENPRFGVSADIPASFIKKGADADGRGQSFEDGSKTRIRVWAMYNNPPMTIDALYGDWTRRPNITFKTLAKNTWVVRGSEGGRLYYTRSILADGVISTIEVHYRPQIADEIEPMLVRMGASLEAGKPPSRK